MADRAKEGYAKQAFYVDPDTGADVQPGDAANKAIRANVVAGIVVPSNLEGDSTVGTKAAGQFYKTPDGKLRFISGDVADGLFSNDPKVHDLLELLLLELKEIKMCILSLHEPMDSGAEFMTRLHPFNTEAILNPDKQEAGMN